MRDATLNCDRTRRLAVASGKYNGIDFVEATTEIDRKGRLEIHFIQDLPEGNIFAGLVVENAESGARLEVRDRLARDAQRKHVLVFDVPPPVAHARYRLRLPRQATSYQPPFDARQMTAEFTFSPSVLTESDFLQRPEPLRPTRAEPTLNYLARDYESFRQLLLDRLALLMPDWREQHAADVQMALVELLAYTGDRLSYQQDAVATEAYLATARRRISIRRHARLVDYRLHEGCNARAFVRLHVEQDSVAFDGNDVFFITSPPARFPINQTTLRADLLPDELFPKWKSASRCCRSP